MKINLITQPVIFTANNSTKFRRDYSARLENNTISERNKSNLTNLTERFASEGLTIEKTVKAAKRNPFLLVQKPETMEHNIRGTVKKFARHGLTVESYIESALSRPELFLSKPETIEKNIKDLASTFAYDGLSINDIFKMAESQASVYLLKSKTLCKKFDKITKEINIERFEIIELLKKQSVTITNSANNIIKKYKLLKYIEENKYFDKKLPIPDADILKPVILKKSFTNSIENNYKILLRNKISSGLKTGEKLPNKKITEALIQYITDNKNKIHTFEIPDGEFAKEFTRFVKNFSKSVIGKNIFRIKIV